MKNIFICLLCLGPLTGLFAQNFQFKPLIGTNLSFQHIALVDNKAPKPGFDIGLLADFRMTKKFFLELGWLYELNRGSLQRTFVYPFNAPYLDAPQVIEKYNLHFLKVPIALRMKSDAAHSAFVSFGTTLKYNLSSFRNGYVIDRPESYSSDFSLRTNGGGRIGIGANASVGKEIRLFAQPFAVQLLADADLTKWKYPTNEKLEGQMSYSMRSYSLALLISYSF